MSFIQVEKLDFEYPGKKALQDVSFSIQEGSVTALVGPNGAGKTTLMRCLAALDKPHGGRLRMGDIDVLDHPRDVHRLCGYLSDFFGLYDALSVRQCLTYAAWCHNIPSEKIDARIGEVVLWTELSDMLAKESGTLSRGYRQRLGIALALVHDPKVLILDEPASGMDPEARIGLSSLMRRLRLAGKTILVSSHILNELEDYCTDMLVIREGRVSDHVSLKNFSTQVKRIMRIGISGMTDAHKEFLKAQAHVTDVRVEEGKLLCIFSGNEQDQRRLLQDLISGNIPVFSYEVAELRLQDAYMNLSHRKPEA